MNSTLTQDRSKFSDFDFEFLPFNFEDTEITVVPITVFARKFTQRKLGAGAVSFTVKKSEAPSFADYLISQGFSCN